MSYINLNYLSWWTIRLFPLTAIFGIIFDFELLFLVQGFLLLHIKAGFESIINDYIHSNVLRLIYLILLRILVLEIILYSLEFFL